MEPGALHASDGPMVGGCELMRGRRDACLRREDVATLRSVDCAPAAEHARATLRVSLAHAGRPTARSLHSFDVPRGGPCSASFGGEGGAPKVHDKLALDGSQPPQSLPHHRLEVWHLSLELVKLVHRIQIGDADFRAEARSSVKGCISNIAEGAGRRSRADKQRVYAIARGEVGECISAIESAGAIGACAAQDVAAATQLGGRIAAMLWRLG